jgi:hypothetical protein
MAAKACADIKPTGMKQGDLIDILYMIGDSLSTLTTKLDADAGVTDTDYNQLCFDDLLNIVAEDQHGNFGYRYRTESNTIPPAMVMGPNGIMHLTDLIYMFFSMMRTLTRKLDADCTYTNYEALAYTATMCLQSVKNSKGNILGGNDTFRFNPQGQSQAELVEFLYNIINSIHIICHDNVGISGLDGDGGVTDTDYEQLCYTDIITLTVENRKGDRIGN